MITQAAAHHTEGHRSSLIVACVLQVLSLVFGALALDGRVLLAACATAVVIYWIAAVLMLRGKLRVHKWANQSLRYGYLGFLLVSYGTIQFGQHMRGVL